MIGQLLDLFGLRRLTAAEERARDRRHPYGKGTGRAAYAVVQRRRAANRRARAARRITRRRSR